MTAYIIHPKITFSETPQAVRFYEKCLDELLQHVPTQNILTDEVMEGITLQKEDVVIFFNNNQNYPVFVIDFLEDAVAAGSELLPVAMRRDDRVPPSCVKKAQSFDVNEQLRQRSLSESYIETVAIVLARTVISILQPTLTKNNMYLFLSHRRIDGEKIAGAFYDAFALRAQQAFRDLNKVLVGEDAQEVIEENLRQCDAVVYLDTPRSGESKWIALELEVALSRGVPIVWVRIGPEEGRAKDFWFKPAEVPHFHFPNIESLDEYVDPEIVDEVIHKAFEISRAHAKEVLGHLKRIRALAKRGTIKLTELNKKYFTYQIEIPRHGFRYFQRPMTHIVSFYGRLPKEHEHEQFLKSVARYGYEPHPQLGTIYDTALILAPIASQHDERLLEEPHKVDSCDEYLNCLEHYVRFPIQSQTSMKGIIISGAFPDCEPEHQQHITDAVRAFTQAILTRNSKVIFGAHPTFQHLIFDMAKQINSQSYKDAVKMYVSRHFVKEEDVIGSRKHATVMPVDEVDKDRNKSLSAMRKSMIDDPDALCMVVIGGKTKRHGIPPGIDEEIKLARSRRLPVFLIGSAGGRTAEITAEMDADDWNQNLNDLPSEFNHELMVSLDYSALANDILDKMGL
ncbi:SLOG domain-containing protein [Bacillus sp. FSL L8-0152]|uniref:SLOG domain-containing protein n=1 Tax=Bacillus sp. FSL L8-0152 TaxID=2921516 RepID=UPI0030F985E2